MELTVCVKIFREKFMYEQIREPDNIFVIVESGSFYLSDGKQEAVVGAGEATVFLQDVKYCRRVIEPVTMYFFRFKTKKQIKVGFKMQFKDKERIASDFRLLHQLDNGLYADDMKYRKVLFDDLMMQYFLENSECGIICEKTDELMRQAVIEIKNSLHKKIDLAYIARSLNLSYVCFARHFKGYTGSTPSDYIAKERMKLARKFLLESDLLIKDIAAACGFDNEYYFSNFFKKYNGISPSEFRRKIM